MRKPVPKRTAEKTPPSTWECAEPGCDEVIIHTGRRGRPRKWCVEHIWKSDSKTETCSEVGCGRPRRANGLCNAHYRRTLRAAGREKNPEWDERAKRNYATRRDRLDGAKNSDSTMLRALIHRGDSICPECGEKIDLSLEWPHPMYRTIDHKIPLARGGKHDLANCRLMHYQCNVAKGVRL